MLNEIAKKLGLSSEKNPMQCKSSSVEKTAEIRYEDTKEYKDKLNAELERSIAHNKATRPTVEKWVDEFKPVVKEDRWVTVNDYDDTNTTVGRINIKELKTVIECAYLTCREAYDNYAYIKKPNDRLYSDSCVNTHFKTYEAFSIRLYTTKRGSLIASNFDGTRFYLVKQMNTVPRMRKDIVDAINFVENGLNGHEFSLEYNGILKVNLLEKNISEDFRELYCMMETL